VIVRSPGIRSTSVGCHSCLCTRCGARRRQWSELSDAVSKTITATAQLTKPPRPTDKSFARPRWTAGGERGGGWFSGSGGGGAASAFIDARGDDGWTALMEAAGAGHTSVVEVLLAHGADTSLSDEAGLGVVWVAAQQGHAAVVGQLLAAGAAPEQPRGSDGATPLSIAAQKGHRAVVDVLLSADSVDAGRARKDGSSPLLVAARNDNVEVVRRLLAAPTVQPNQAQADGTTPLFAAARNGHSEVVQAVRM
jgi:hypothetical protein